MKALVDAEVLKLRSTRMVAGLLFATVCLVVLTLAATVPTVGANDSPVSLDEPALLARVVGISLTWPEVLILLLGVLAFTQEFRYGTASSTFLVAPRRTRVLAAKWLGLTLASLPITVGMLVVSLIISIPVIRSRDGTAIAGADLWQVMAAAFVVLALYAVIGVSVGALIRSQIAAVAGVLVWIPVEQFLASEYPAVGRWTPTGSTFGLLQLGAMVTTKGALLTAPIGGLVLAGYATLAGVLALIVTRRRDVL